MPAQSLLIEFQGPGLASRVWFESHDGYCCVWGGMLSPHSVSNVVKGVVLTLVIASLARAKDFSGLYGHFSVTIPMIKPL